MIFLIGGESHTGKTLLAQRLLERTHYPYMSLDHLKMGFIRGVTPPPFRVDEDSKIASFLWGITEGIIHTCLENHQNLIIEGVYLQPQMIRILLDSMPPPAFDATLHCDSIMHRDSASTGNSTPHSATYSPPHSKLCGDSIPACDTLFRFDSVPTFDSLSHHNPTPSLTSLSHPTPHSKPRLERIKVLFLMFSKHYILSHYDVIFARENIIERRVLAPRPDRQTMIQEHQALKAQCQAYNLPFLEIQNHYESEIAKAFKHFEITS